MVITPEQAPETPEENAPEPRQTNAPQQPSSGPQMSNTLFSSPIVRGIRSRLQLIHNMQQQLRPNGQAPTVTNNEPFHALFGERFNARELSSRPREEQIDTLAQAAYAQVESFTKRITDQLNNVKPEERIRALFGLLSNPDTMSEDSIRGFLPRNLRRNPARFGGLVTNTSTTGFSGRVLSAQERLTASARTTVASAVLNTWDIPHEIASVHNHSFILIPSNGHYTYFDPHYGNLVQFSMSAIQAEQHVQNSAEGIIASIDINQVDTPIYQGVAPMHRNFVLHDARNGVAFQALRNMANQNPQEHHGTYNDIDRWRSTLFTTLPTAPGYTEEGIMQVIDSPIQRMQQQLVLFRELVEHNWQITDDALMIARQNQLFGIKGETKDQQKLSLLMSVLHFQNWSSTGEADELGRLLAEVTGHPNTRGATIEDFVENQSTPIATGLTGRYRRRTTSDQPNREQTTSEEDEDEGEDTNTISTMLSA